MLFIKTLMRPKMTNEEMWPLDKIIPDIENKYRDNNIFEFWESEKEFVRNAIIGI
jgi:hypothetical protein